MVAKPLLYTQTVRILLRSQMITEWNSYFQLNEVKACDVDPPGQGQKEQNKLRIGDPEKESKL